MNHLLKLTSLTLERCCCRRSAITDQGFARLSRLGNLKYLRFSAENEEAEQETESRERKETSEERRASHRRHASEIDGGVDGLLYIGDAGVSALSSCSHLESVFLDGVRIGNASLIALSQLSALSTLSIRIDLQSSTGAIPTDSYLDEGIIALATHCKVGHLVDSASCSPFFFFLFPASLLSFLSIDIESHSQSQRFFFLVCRNMCSVCPLKTFFSAILVCLSLTFSVFLFLFVFRLCIPFFFLVSSSPSFECVETE